MDWLITLVEFILILGLLMFVHELGHFLAARAFHIEVLEFGFGLPPRAKKLFNVGKTEVTLNWIPFGAFVLPKGEGDPNVPGGLAAAHPLQRLGVLLAGPFMNLLLGFILLVIILVSAGTPDTSRVSIANVTDGYPAKLGGILPGDILVKINGTPVTSQDVAVSLIRGSNGSPVVVTIDRQGNNVEYSVTPRFEKDAQNPNNAGRWVIGVELSNPRLPVSLGNAFGQAAGGLGTYVREMVLLPGRLIQGQISPEQGRIVGPVGIFNFFQQARNRDVTMQAQSSGAGAAAGELPAGINVLDLVAFISIALGFTNLLPIPALDGGRILFLLPELLFRKRIPAKYENAVNTIGLLALMLLLVVITAQDIFNPSIIP